MMFLLIYLLFQGQFLYVEVNGNEEDVTIFLTNMLRCVQNILVETDNVGHDSMMLESLFFELNGYARTISFFLSTDEWLEGGEIKEIWVHWRHCMHVLIPS